MQLALDILAAVTIVFGLFFMLVGAVGLVRFPDTYHRLHAASKCSTLGLVGLLLGTVCHVRDVGILTQALLVIVFAFVATPVGTHILAKAAIRTGGMQWEKTCSDDYAEDHRSE